MSMLMLTKNSVGNIVEIVPSGLAQIPHDKKRGYKRYCIDLCPYTGVIFFRARMLLARSSEIHHFPEIDGVANHKRQ